MRAGATTVPDAAATTLAAAATVVVAAVVVAVVMTAAVGTGKMLLVTLADIAARTFAGDELLLLRKRQDL